eukprot:UN07587
MDLILSSSKKYKTMNSFFVKLNSMKNYLYQPSRNKP